MENSARSTFKVRTGRGCSRFVEAKHINGFIQNKFSRDL
jgi:hypothetical protein